MLHFAQSARLVHWQQSNTTTRSEHGKPSGWKPLAQQRGISGHEPVVARAVNIDVCVVCYDSEATLPALASSVVEHLPSVTRLLLWSNSAGEELASAAHDLMTGLALAVEVFGDGSNLGFARACNLLAQSSDREWLLF